LPVKRAEEDITTRFDTQRRLSELVMALREPYRTTVLLRYYDGLSAVEIAERLDLPAATVRGRLKTGLDELRSELAKKYGGRREDWLAALTPLLANEWRWVRPGGAVAVGAAAVSVTVVATAIFLLVLGGKRPTRTEAIVQSEQAQPLPQVSERIPPRVASATPSQQAAPLSDVEKAARSAERLFVPLGAGPVRGPAEAKVTIVELIDYQCAPCARMEGTMERILWTYEDQVRLQVLHLPSAKHAQALPAARAALAASRQDKFWDMHYWLLAKHRTLSEVDMEAFAADLGLDLPRFRADQMSDAVTRQMEIDAATAESLGVGDAPAFFVNGRPLKGTPAFAAIAPIIDQEIAFADELLERGVKPEQLYNVMLENAGKETK
jgi:protein-disulfide isomerase